MSRTVVTAQLLDELHRTQPEIVLPRGALVTPAARDWLRAHRVTIQWADPDTGATGTATPVVIDARSPWMRSILTAVERVLGAVEAIDPADKAGGQAAAIGRLCAAVASGSAAHGIIFADDGGLPVCLANKHKGVRAVLGVSQAAVEQAVRQFAANVLVIEPGHQTIYQVRQMVQRFITLKPGDAASAAVTAIRSAEGDT